MLMLPDPKPVMPDIPAKPLPLGTETRNIDQKAMAAVDSDIKPIEKTKVKPVEKNRNTTVTKKKVSVKSIKRERPVIVEKADNDNIDSRAGGSAGGYGVASQTGQGVPGGVGLSAGIGNGSGGGSGPGDVLGPGSGKGSGADVYTEPNYKANYAINPKPKYPPLARDRGWVGTVLLRVRVSDNGSSEQVAVHRSSGHELLDDAAIIAVQKWRFIPAKKGTVAVASTVIVPITYSLKQ